MRTSCRRIASFGRLADEKSDSGALPDVNVPAHWRERYENRDENNRYREKTEYNCI